jgi:hypothetical protein
MGISKGKFILIILSLLLLLNCYGSTPKELVLFDFESDSELDQLRWKCHTLFSLSDEHATHGKRSLKLELFPSDYPGLTPMLKENDWGRYKALCFDIYNPGEKQIQVSVRIDDKNGYPDYAEQYNKSFNINPGMNQMSIPLNTLVTSGTERKLDLKNIYRVLIFMVRPEKKVTLYLDYMRLI